MDLVKWLGLSGLVITLFGAIWGAWKAASPYSEVHVGSYEELERKRQSMTNHLRGSLGLVALGTLLQIIATVVAE